MLEVIKLKLSEWLVWWRWWRRRRRRRRWWWWFWHTRYHGFEI